MKSTKLGTQGMSNNWIQNSVTPRDLMTTPYLGSPSQGLLNGGIQNSTQDQVLSVPSFVQGNQFHRPSPSPRILTAWEKILHQRYMRSLGRARNANKAYERGENDPIKHTAQRQLSEKVVGQKSSVYRGVTKCSEVRFEAFVWDNTNPREKGKTVYIGGFKSEVEAARAHDLVAIKIWGKYTLTNFPVSSYLKEISEMKSMSKKEYILAIRRAGKDSSKTESDYLGVSRNTESQKWEARVGKGNGMTGIYLGTFNTEEDAARAYDVASIRLKGRKAITNFHLRSYDVQGIIESSKLPIEEGVSGSLKEKTDDDVLLQRKDNEAYHPYAKPPEHKSSSSLDQHNYHDQLLDQHLIPSSPFRGHQNHDLIQSSPYVLDGLTGTGAEVGIEGNIAGDYGATFPHQGSTIEQSMQLGTGQESQAPQALENQENTNEFLENLFDNQFLHQSPSLPLLHDYQDLGFQNDLSFHHWTSDFGTPFEGNTETLSSAFSGESSMNHMVNENLGAENGVSSFGLHSTGVHPVELYNQEFEAPNLPVLDQSYEPYQYGLNQDPHQNLSSCFPNDFQNPSSETNTGFQGEMADSQNDFDISQYLNTSYMGETDWTGDVDELWAVMEADWTTSSTSNLGFKEDGTQQ